MPERVLLFAAVSKLFEVWQRLIRYGRHDIHGAKAFIPLDLSSPPVSYAEGNVDSVSCLIQLSMSSQREQ